MTTVSKAFLSYISSIDDDYVMAFFCMDTFADGKIQTKTFETITGTDYAPPSSSDIVNRLIVRIEKNIVRMENNIPIHHSSATTESSYSMDIFQFDRSTLTCSWNYIQQMERFSGMDMKPRTSVDIDVLYEGHLYFVSDDFDDRRGQLTLSSLSAASVFYLHEHLLVPFS